MSDKRPNEIIDKMLTGMENFISTKTVVGGPIQLGDTTILPLMDVCFGMAAKSGAGEKRDSAGSGIGGKMSPAAVLVVQKGQVRLVNVKNQDTMTRLLDMVPEVINRFSQPKGVENPVTDQEAVDIAFDRSENADAP